MKLGALISVVNPDIVGLVEAPSSEDRTSKFVKEFLNDEFEVYHAEKRGFLGLAFLVKKELNIDVTVYGKSECLKRFKLDKFDADNDGIKENYSWSNRVPYEVQMSGGPFSEPTTLILVHAKSKGAFIPGDLFAYEKLSRANRMKLRAQAASIRKRLDELVDESGNGRVVILGDMNDGPEFDNQFALLGGAFLEPVMGSIWEPKKVFSNTHMYFPEKDRWTIDFKDRVVNYLESSRYGQPSELRSWIDHILVSPDLSDKVIYENVGIIHNEPKVSEVPGKYKTGRATDHHPPYADIDF